MSTDLTLIPFGPSHEQSHTLLGPIEPSQGLIEALSDLQVRCGRDVPLTFNTFRGEDDDEHGPHWCNTQEDAFGNRLKHVSVADLLGLSPPDLLTPMIEDSWLASSAWAYLSHLPEDWRVALYWH